MVTSEIRSAIEELSLLPVNLKSAAPPPDSVPVLVSAPVHVPVQINVHIPIKPFLALCNLLVQILGLSFSLTHIHRNTHVQFTRQFLFYFIYDSVDLFEKGSYFADKIGPTMAVLRQDIRQNIEVN